MSLSFDPSNEVTKRIVKEGIDTWSVGTDDIVYIVVDDCGPCVIAAFAFDHHAQDFLGVLTQTAYAVDSNGNPLTFG